MSIYNQIVKQSESVASTLILIVINALSQQVERHS
jgi:hypothetical protein